MVKKIIAVLFALSMSIGLFAQTEYFKTSSYCEGKRNSYGNITWGNWEKCVLTIKVSDCYINVGSQRVQHYTIVEMGDTYFDGQNNLCMDLTAYDEENIYMDIRFVEDSGGVAMYFFYSNVAWAYYIPGETIW